MVIAVEKKSKQYNKDKYQFIRSLDDVSMSDIDQVGGKNASLGEMIQQLTSQGINIPKGFAITADAYRYFIKKTKIWPKLTKLLSQLKIEDIIQLQKQSNEIRSLIIQTPFPPELSLAIANAYQELCQEYGANTSVAVRSSATAEDLPNASFAGQQDTYLNIAGIDQIITACHKCIASLFSDRAISYRHHQGFDHSTIALSIGIQKMVRSDLATSGVMFTINTETGHNNSILITASYGLGETIVQGQVNPDEYLIFKPTCSLIEKRLGTKEIKLTTNGLEEVAIADQAKYALTDPQIKQLAQWGTIIENHYSQIRSNYTPMDIEWAIDGITQEIYLVQARPETVQSQKNHHIIYQYKLLADQATPILTGRSIGSKIGSGEVRIVIDPSEIHLFKPGEILVTDKTDPDWEPIMQQAAAIVTNNGGRTCHAAIIARELGIPAVVGCGNATQLLSTGMEVTVSCAQGDEGYIYQGRLPYQVEELELDKLPPSPTQIMMNLGNPDKAFSLATIPNDGVGLARLEFIIAEHIKIHPLALLQYDQLLDPDIKKAIAIQTHQYPNKPDYFIDRLTSGVAKIAAAFYPKPVIVRMSDLKSNEYANLLGGKQFEPIEENPMLGWRGAARYYDPKYQAAFGLECIAMKRIRDEIGLTNVILMIPFCRTPQEGEKVLAEMAKYGLKRGENNLEIYVMCELPSNVLLAEQFAQIFDGFSIGSNDLTQLTLGLDRDSGLVANLFDERNPAIKRMIEIAIKAAKKHHCKIGICGQAPSDYPDFAQFLINLGIDSISLNPDSVLKVRLELGRL